MVEILPVRSLPLCLFKRGGISIITSKVWSTTRICPRSSAIFIIHVALGNIIRKYGISFHCYADDTQLYISTRPDETSKLSKLTECVKNIKDWMANNFLLLNSDKTELLLIGPKNSTQNLLDYNLQLDRCAVTSFTVKNLGVMLDSNLSF